MKVQEPAKAGKVVSLADRRTVQTGILLCIDNGAFAHPKSRSRYDAYIEQDGSLVLRLDADSVTFVKHESLFGAEPPIFTARGNAFVFRIASIDVQTFQRDMVDLSIGCSQHAARQRGDHLWLCTAVGDGCYRVQHAQKTAVFEPFKPRLRDGLVPDGPRHESGFQAMKSARVAPKCSACARVVQLGEVMFRERREVVKPRWGAPCTASRKFGGVKLCSTCISKAPREGIQEAGSVPDAP